ncbi:wax ester/triacylglycerol synthase domain-containing protein [Rhodococcus sp. NPDC054953]
MPGSLSANLVAVRLAPRDAANVYGESDRCPANIVDAYVFGADACTSTFDEVAAWVTDCLECSAIFRRTLWRSRADVAYPAWVEDGGFGVRNHISVVAARDGWAGVEDVVSDRLAQRMDLSRPPWDITVMPGVMWRGASEPVTIVVLRFHHSIGDGVATTAIARRMFVAHPIESTDQEGTPGRHSDVAAISHLPLALLRFVGGVASAPFKARAVARAAQRGELVMPKAEWPPTRFNRPLEGLPIVGVVPVSLNEAREAKKAVEGATVNDVVLTVIAGALRRLLARSVRPTSSHLVPSLCIPTKRIRLNGYGGFRRRPKLRSSVRVIRR